MLDPTKLALIRQYVKAGIYVYPVYVSRRPDGKKDVRPIGRWREGSSVSLADVEAWWGELGEHQDAGVLVDCGKSGIVVVDADGEEGIANWKALNPPETATSRTLNGGEHYWFRAHPDHVIGNDQDGKVAEKVDVRGLGGLVIAPPSKGYEWADPADPLMFAHLPMVPQVVINAFTKPKEKPATPYDGEVRAFTQAEAEAFVKKAYEKLSQATSGFNGAINNFAMSCAHFPQWFDRARCAKLMIKALKPTTGWTAPDRDDLKTIDSAYSATEAGRSWMAVERVEEKAPEAPRLYIQSPADMTYWLQEHLGAGALSGFFLRDGHIAHTPRVNEDGYVHARGVDDAGPAQIQAVSAGQVAAKIQYAHRCYKVVKDKETKEDKEVTALFPLEAAKRAIDAPEAMQRLRPLKGITLTPMMRADGTVLSEAGYDAASGYLYLPEAGVDVPPIPEDPSRDDVMQARKLLADMTAGFPWESEDDRANYYGLLLTPLLRMMTPPSYKMFGIGAHQPGSGKTLLADIARIIHGGVFRSEMPEDEAETKKMSAALLSTTSAPVVHIDNITGVLRSAVLAGLLTADGDIQERELGKSTNLTYRNDRVWVVTGNNLSLGGDLVRRTIIITIDPNMANPETRSFEIPDLKAWVREHRNELLWSLLTLIRLWVAEGAHPAVRAQSDSFARWEAVVAGILETAGIEGRFDLESGKKAATGGDDDGLAQVLERIWETQQGGEWTVAQVLKPQPGQMVVEDRDWLPSPVLDKLARSEAAGKKTFGYWLRNRLGRWVSGSDGHSYVIRQSASKRDGSALWYLERTA